MTVPEEFTPAIGIHQFTENFLSTPVFFQVQTMKDSLIVYIGGVSNGEMATGNEGSKDPECRFDNLALGMPTAITTSRTTSLLATSVDDPSSRMAGRIAGKLRLQVFLSCNLPPSNPELLAWAEKTAFQCIRKVVV